MVAFFAGRGPMRMGFVTAVSAQAVGGGGTAAGIFAVITGGAARPLKAGKNFAGVLATTGCKSLATVS